MARRAPRTMPGWEFALNLALASSPAWLVIALLWIAGLAR